MKQAAQPKTISSHSYEPTNDRTILRFVDREGNWTHYWIKSHKIFVPAVNHIIRMGYPKGERFYNYLLRATPSEAERKLKTAGEEGSRTHEALRDLIRGDSITLDTRYFNEITQRYEPLNHDEWTNIEAFAAWCTKYEPKVLINEQAVWSATYKYAGTIDFLGTILVPEGDKTFSREMWGTRILILLDWKTSGGIWDDYELQIASYRNAALEYLQNKLPLQEYKNMWTGIVRIGTSHKSGFEMKVWDQEDSQANFKLFLSALDIFKKKTGDDYVPEIKIIPAEFSVYVPRLRVPPKKKVILKQQHISKK
ncbi:MAG: hypothetical protein M3Q63_02095 [bacterium]|nr:hypothetical protein [bacterium]